MKRIWVQAVDAKIKPHLTPEQAQKWANLRLGQQQLGQRQPIQRFGSAEQVDKSRKLQADRQAPTNSEQGLASPAAQAPKQSSPTN